MSEGVQFTVLSCFTKPAIDAMFWAEITWIWGVELYLC